MVPDEEVIEMYEGSHVPLEQMSDFYGKVRGTRLSALLKPIHVGDPGVWTWGLTVHMGPGDAVVPEVSMCLHSG